MPPVVGVFGIADGFEILLPNAVIKRLQKADIPQNVINKPIADVEAWANAWLAANLDGMDAYVHIDELTPELKIKVIVCNEGYVPPANWWVPPVMPNFVVP